MAKFNGLGAALCALAIAALSAAPAPALAADDSHSLTVRLDWLPAGYHAPIWLAVDKGWFKKAGIEVAVADGNGSATTAQLVGAGQVDIGWAALSNMAFARSKGIPLISVAGFFRKGDLVLIVPKDSPIQGPKDLRGKKLVTTPGALEAPFLDPFFAIGGLTRSDVNLLNVDASAKVSTYITSDADGVFTSTAFTLPVVNPKRPSRPLLFADFGLNVPSFGLFTSEAVLKQKPDAVKKFASIVAGAWAYALNGHEDEAVQAVLKSRPQARLDATLLTAQLKASEQFLYTPTTKDQPIGVQTDQDWAAAIKAMEEAKMIEPGSKPKDYYTNAYLDMSLLKNPAGG
ncbi:MAG TPA: ABC transporter substrate-binding protein [Stellaceae bacterium]|nr:ABC transporter substrate-binding protein [Stellaceae bacterium]